MKEKPKPGYRLLLSDDQVVALKRLALDRGVPMQEMCRGAVLALLSQPPQAKAPIPTIDSDSPFQRLEQRNDTLAVFLRELARIADSDPRWGGKQ